MRVLVIGSINMDLVVETEKYPVKGETVAGTNFFQMPGGKGANQAVAIGRLKGSVAFIGACGQDEHGHLLINNLKKAGVDISYIERVDITTGIAVITLDKSGDNRIVIVPGANERVTPAVIAKNEAAIREADIILLQLEIPLETVIYSIEMAKRYQKTVILDPAPAYELPAELYDKIDYLLPNEIEITRLVADEKLQSCDDMVNRLLELGVGNILLTQGAKGATLYSSKTKQHFPAPKVQAVDTTGAGDTFAGAFAYGLSQAWPLEEIIRFAAAAGSLSVTKIGAQAGMPTLEEIAKIHKKTANNLPPLII